MRHPERCPHADRPDGPVGTWSRPAVPSRARRRLRLAPAGLIGVVCLSTAMATRAETERMPLDEVRAGMVGIGLTVFDGTEREEFRAHILGVLRNVSGPQRNLILARLEGGPLAETGVIQGMSGSPVYIDNRLIGAVSYSMGAFATQPIAGITPIDEMIEAVSLPSPRRAAPSVAIELPATPERFVASLRTTLARLAPPPLPGTASSPGPATGSLPSPAVLRPIGTPVVMGGFDHEVASWLSELLARPGLRPVSAVGGGGVASQAARPSASPPAGLEPGDPVGVSLISGDLLLAGTGTVTMVDGDQVYAFGHPFYNLGPTQFQMNRAQIYTLLPSLFTSSKIAAIGEPIGTIQQDRATAIAGTLGSLPAMIPVTLTLETGDGRRPAQVFRFEMVRDQTLTPLLSLVAIYNTLRSYEREAGSATFTVSGRARVADQVDLIYDDVFAGESPSMSAATYIAAPLTALLTNPFAPVEIEGLDLTITSLEEPRSATLTRVWIDELRAKPGTTVSLNVLSRTHRGDDLLQSLPVRIPERASGRLSLMVTSGPSLAQWERQTRGAPDSQSVEQLIRVINDARRNSRLYVRLLDGSPGAVVGGEMLTSLPPSMLAVYRADLTGGPVTPLRQATIEAWELPADYAIVGSHVLSLDVGTD